MISKPNRLALTVAWTIAVPAAVPALGQWTGVRSSIPRKPDGKPNLSASLPRTTDGKPDLSGVWVVSQGFVDEVPKYMRNLAADLSPDGALRCSHGRRNS